MSSRTATPGAVWRARDGYIHTVAATFFGDCVGNPVNSKTSERTVSLNGYLGEKIGLAIVPAGTDISIVTHFRELRPSRGRGRLRN